MVPTFRNHMYLRVQFKINCNIKYLLYQARIQALRLKSVSASEHRKLLWGHSSGYTYRTPHLPCVKKLKLVTDCTNDDVCRMEQLVGVSEWWLAVIGGFMEAARGEAWHHWPHPCRGQY